MIKISLLFLTACVGLLFITSPPASSASLRDFGGAIASQEIIKVLQVATGSTVLC